MSIKKPDKTSMQISSQFWKFLNQEKSKPNESLEQVLIRLLNSGGKVINITED